jgi:uncharacterized protein (DUF3084 family)
VSELQFIHQDIANRKKAIAKREEEINQLLERIQEYLKPKQQKKEQELSNVEDNLKQDLPVWISGYILRGVGRNRFELSEDRQNIPKDKLEHDIDKAVDYLIRAYR